MKLSVPLLAALAAIPSASCFVTSSTPRPSTTSLGVAADTKLTPPKKVADLATTSEELYNENVQTTYGYVDWMIESQGLC